MSRLQVLETVRFIQKYYYTHTHAHARARTLTLAPKYIIDFSLLLVRAFIML